MSLFKLRHAAALVSVVAASLAFATATTAAPISIFNTGVDPSANALVGTGTPDPHYSIISPLNTPAVTVNDPGYPFPFWLPNNAFSRWVGPAGDSNGVPGLWIYRTTFTLPPTAILATASITGDWATDDNGSDIRINGIPTGQTDFGMGSLAPFSISSGFVVGLNTLDFYVNNANIGINPTGLRVDHIAGSYQVVPEPGTLVLIGGVLPLCAAWSRRKRKGVLNA